jgi:hypothetical protein
MKATKAEISQRVEEVLRIRLDGAQMHDILQYASEKKWGVGERQLWNYVAASDDRLTARMEKDGDKLLARHIAQRRTLYARAINAADYRTALAVAKDEAELQGLYPSGKLELTGKGGGPMRHEYAQRDLTGLTDDELRRQYQEEIDQAPGRPVER